MKRSPLLRYALPGLVAVGLLAAVFARLDVASVLSALRGARWERYGLLAALFTAIWLLIDALVISRLVSRFHQPVSPRDVLPLRGASYLMMAFSYDAAQAALGLALSRRHAIPLLALGGSFAFYYGIDLFTIGALGTLGSWSAPPGLPPLVSLALPVVVVGMAAVLVGGAVVARAQKRHLPRFLHDAQVLETLRTCRARDFAEFVGWRVLFYISFVGFAVATLPAFDIHVPWQALVSAVPVVMSLSALPITLSGIGSTQVAMLLLYGSFADEAQIVAYSVTYSATLVLFRLPIGLACLPLVSEVWAGRDDLGTSTDA